MITNYRYTKKVMLFFFNTSIGRIVFLFFPLLLFLKTAHASEENRGLPLVYNYKSSEYNSHPQNWGIIQDDRGVMYFANVDGVLVYDGSSWDLIELPNKNPSRALGKDSDGIIYTAGSNEIGYLQPNSKGKLKFVSLVDSLGINNFGNIRSILVIENTIYFRSDEYLIRLNQGKFTYWKAKSTFSVAFTFDENLYIHDNKNGLFKVVNDSLELAPSGEEFINKDFYFAQQYQDEVFLANRINGLYVYKLNSQQEKRLTPIVSVANKILTEDFVYTGIITKDGKIILGTNNGGCVVVNREGKILSKINEETGILQNKIHAILIDKDDNLWLALDKGISKCDYSGLISFWCDKNGLNGMVQSIIEHDGKMYIGTLQGIYTLENSKVSKIQSSTSQTWSLLNYKIPHSNDEILIIAAVEGIFMFKQGHVTEIFKSSRVFKLYQSSKKPNIIYFGNEVDIGVLEYRNGEFIFKGIIPNTGLSIRSLLEEDDGDIWAASFRDGVTRITPSEDPIKPQKIVHYSLESGFPSLKNILIYRVNKNILFATEQGLYSFNKKTNRFTPSNLLTNIFNGKSKDIFNLVEDTSGGIYITQLINDKGSIGYAERKIDGSYDWNSKIYNKIPQMMMLSSYLDKNGDFWIGGSEGLFKIEKLFDSNNSNNFPTLIRNVKIKIDSCIFYGNNFALKNGKRIFTTTQDESLKYRIDYRYNSIRFSYSAPEFSNEYEVKYQYKLEGYDDQWSDWTESKIKEYTNLPEGSYKFFVVSKNIYENKGSEASFEFTILPPWYRTIEAFIAYFVSFILLVFLIVRISIRQLKRQNIYLEKQVQLRTAEISQQKEELIAQAEALERNNIELEKLSIVASKTDNAVMILDENFYFEWVNEGFRKLYGLTFKEQLSYLGRSFIEESRCEKIKELTNLCRTAKNSVHYETTIYDLHKQSIWVQTTITPIIDDFDNIKKYIAIDTDITELKQAELAIYQQNERIQKQRDELEIANATKDKFFSIIAHDLRNPFNLILGFTDLLIDKINEKDFENSLKLAEVTNQTTLTAFELLENLLTWSRAQTGKISFKPENINVKNLIDTNIHLLIGLAENKGIRLSSSAEKKNVIFADKNMILTVLRNLITNAIKFSKKDDQISIEVEESVEEVTIRVRDTGIGMDEKIIEKLFLVNENVKTEGTANERGTGLGLILCKEFVEWHKGKIWVESKKGVGSCFSFTLPKIKE